MENDEETQKEKSTTAQRGSEGREYARSSREGSAGVQKREAAATSGQATQEARGVDFYPSSSRVDNVERKKVVLGRVYQKDPKGRGPVGQEDISSEEKGGKPIVAIRKKSISKGGVGRGYFLLAKNDWVIVAERR